MISISTLFLASLVFNAATVFGAPVRVTPGNAASEAVPRAITVIDTPVARANIVEVPVQRRSNLGRITRRSARLNTRQEEEDINLPRGFVDVTPEPQQQKRHHSNEQPEVVRRFPRRVYAEYYGKREPATKIKETTIVIEKTTVHDTPYDAMASNMHKAVTHVSNVHNVNNLHTTNNHQIVQPPSSHQAGGQLPPDMLAMVLSGQMGTVMSMSQTTTIQNYQPGATPPPMMGMGGMGMGMGMGMYADKNGMVMSSTAAADPAAATVDPNAAAAATSTDTAAVAAATPDPLAAAADPNAAAVDPNAAAVDPNAAVVAGADAADDAPDASDDAAAATATESAAASTDTAVAAAATPDAAAAAGASVVKPDAAAAAAVTPAATPATGAAEVAATTTAAAAATPSVDPLAPAAAVTPPAAGAVIPPVAGTDPSLAPAAPAAEVAKPPAAAPVTPLTAGEAAPAVSARSNGASKGVIISREPVFQNGPEVRSAQPSTEPISKRSISYSGASWASAVRRGFK